MELLWTLAVIIASLVVGVCFWWRKKARLSAKRRGGLSAHKPLWADSAAPEPDQRGTSGLNGTGARLEAQCLAEEIHRERDAAFAAPPGSDARNDGVGRARVLVHRLRDLAVEHPEFGIRGLDAMCHDLDAVEATDQRAIRPRADTLATAGLMTVAFLDTETTGLGESDEMVSLGLLLTEVVLPKGHFVRAIEEFYAVREPGVPINPRAQAVHGLSAEALYGKSFDLSQIRSLIEQADVLIAHNASFDRRMLAKLIPDVMKWPWRCSYRQVGWPGGLANKKLDTICTHFNVERQQPHNALSDARVMMDCLLMPTGKTARSRSYLADCLSKPNF